MCVKNFKLNYLLKKCQTAEGKGEKKRAIGGGEAGAGILLDCFQWCLVEVRTFCIFFLFVKRLS